MIIIITTSIATVIPTSTIQMSVKAPFSSSELWLLTTSLFFPLLLESSNSYTTITMIMTSSSEIPILHSVTDKFVPMGEEETKHIAKY